jgi:hypothetical protein
VTREQVAEAVAQEYQPENLASAFRAREDSPRLAQETQLAVCHFANRLHAGDCAQFVELLGRLNAGSDQEDYQFASRLTPLLECCRDMLRKPGQPLSPDDCAAIAAQMRNIFKDRDNIYFNDPRGFNTLLVAMHGQAGQVDEANKWINTVSENCRHQLANESVNDDIWKFGLRLNAPATATADNVEARLRFVQNVLQYAVDRQWMRWNPGQPYYLEGAGNDNVFVAIVKSGLLSDADLNAHGDQLVGSVNNLPLVTAAWAAWLQTAKEHERAAKLWQTVVDAEIKQADKDKGAKPKISEQHTAYVLGLAATLHDSGQRDAAAKALKLLDGKEVPNSMRGPVAEFRKRMSKPVAGPDAKSN